MFFDPRFGIHNVSVQALEPTYNDPKRKLTHTSKYGQDNRRVNTSAPLCGVVTPIHKRGRFRLK